MNFIKLKQENSVNPFENFADKVSLIKNFNISTFEVRNFYLKNWLTIKVTSRQQKW